LIDLELASPEIPNVHGQNDEFIGWFSKVEQVFACRNLGDQEKFKVVFSRLPSCALRWWRNYEFDKGRRKGKEKVRTWKKLRGKLTVSFCAPTYILKHVPPLSKKNGLKSSWMDVHFNKGSPKSSSTLSIPTMLPLKELVCYENKEVNERKEGFNQFDLPPIFHDYDDKEITGFENYGDEELLDCKELGESLVPLCFCEEEELAHNVEFNISPQL